ncbi:disintegrin and metalloproteinase domain-containing protein 12-like isoform X2 [Asterias amurensis]|uniref:disintegrin and metalloproteinase domain-containing protein 12-like isoform X2 n=1 Tax=Asterias amurensis TaxID=7602 RepID=UPI003AB7DDAC
MSWQQYCPPIYLILSLYFLLQTQGLTINLQESEEWGHSAGRAKQLGKLRNYDITEPYRLDGRQRRETHTKTENGHLNEATFVLEVDGEEIIVDLNLNVDLFPVRYMERSQLPDGRTLIRKPDRLHHCYYHGEVRGKNSSKVALSTCDGLSGVIIMDGKSFYVEPLKDSKSQHLVYTPENIKRKKQTRVYDTDEYDEQNWKEQLKMMQGTSRVRRDAFDETKYVELVIVADHTEYIEQGRNKDKVFSRCKEMANAMDLIYRPLSMRVALIGVEVWNEGDQFEVSTNPTSTMMMFHRWRKDHLLPDTYNDNAQFVTGKSFDGNTVGMASLAVMCSLDRSGGVNEDHGVNAADVASTMAHEMGHNMGFVHDTSDRGCKCDAPADTGCVMEPSSGSLPPTIFSSCSEDDLENSLRKGLGACLFNYPKSIFQGPHCGNGFLEKGEECDCGTPEECTNDCCIAETCTLAENATCANGECCEDCQLKISGVRCRDVVNQCDLPEYCTGLDNQCPANVYRQNGEPCANMDDMDAVCYNGQCVTYDDQCKAIWGDGARKAHTLCYEFNAQGSDFGNCGVNEEDGGVIVQPDERNFIACPLKDYGCGKLMCVGGAEFPIIGSVARASKGYRYDSNMNKYTCKSASIDLGEDIPDPGYVSDGSLCGSSTDEFCVESSCKNKTDLRIRDCPYKCYNHGVCNSNNHCHCNPEWAPPLCNSAGYGGSIDSGPARPQDDDYPSPRPEPSLKPFPFTPPRAPTTPIPPGPPTNPTPKSCQQDKLFCLDIIKRNKEISAQSNAVVVLLVLFLGVFPALIIAGIVMYYKRVQLQQILCKDKFTNVPRDANKTNASNGSHSNEPRSRPDIVMSTRPSATRDANVVYKPTTEYVNSRPSWNRPQQNPEGTRPPVAPAPSSKIVRRESSRLKPTNPPPPVPEAPSSKTTQPSPVRKAPTKPPGQSTYPTPAPVYPTPAPVKPSSAPTKLPGGPLKPTGAAALKPPLPKLPTLASSEPSKPSVALRPTASRPPTVPRPKFNANNSAETSSPSEKAGSKPSRPVPPPRPESLRIKNVARPKIPPPVPRRPASTGDPSV